MATKSRVSVVVAASDSAQRLRRLADSLERQTCLDIELVLVGDRSSIGTVETLGALEASKASGGGGVPNGAAHGRKRATRIIYIDSGGPGSAMNAGVQAASGEYVMFADTSDGFADGYVETMRRVAERDGADMAFCGTVTRGAWGERREGVFRSAGPYRYELMGGKEAFGNFYNLFGGRLNLPCAAWSKIVRKSFYADNGLKFTGEFGSDPVMAFKELALAGKVACYNDCLYRRGPHGSRGFRGLLDRPPARSRADGVRTPPGEPHLACERISDFVLSSGLSGDVGIAASAALRFYFLNFRLEYLKGFPDPDFIRGFRAMTDEYHRRLPPFGFEGNEHYVFFQLLLLYLAAVRFGRPDHFARFAAPFREILSGWATGGGEIGGGAGPGGVELGGDRASLVGRLLDVSPEPRRDSRVSGAFRKLFPQLAELALSLASVIGNGRLDMRMEKHVLDMSGWFDEGYFRRSNPDLAGSGSPALQYFVEKGWREGRNPNAWFDVRNFFASRPDLKALGRNPLLQFYFRGLESKSIF
ncbi:MAG: glycosyltransferase family 2 protein [Deltaproteobacteria bacterium]|jgi:glycosyltransferase involved in cell wall biosynthesis|nr:glycosyltransferase family 2 protein [Deltaproteobacteria bacterium]